MLQSLERITTLDNLSSTDINTIPIKASKNECSLPMKRVWILGTNMVTVIDKSIVKRLGISEDNTLFRQEIVENGILLHLVRQDKNQV